MHHIIQCRCTPRCKRWWWLDNFELSILDERSVIISSPNKEVIGRYTTPMDKHRHRADLQGILAMLRQNSGST